jgi:hypothetical protein
MADFKLADFLGEYAEFWQPGEDTTLIEIVPLSRGGYEPVLKWPEARQREVDEHESRYEICFYSHDDLGFGVCCIRSA